MTPFLQMTPLRRLLWLGGVAANKTVEDTASGNPVSFVTDLAKPLSRLVASFLPVQSGTGDPSPENVRPITGWTGLNVWHGGKNLLDKTNVINGYFTVSGDNTIIYSSSAGRIVWCPCKPDTVYTLSKMTGGKRLSVYTSEETPETNMVVYLPTRISGSGNNLYTFRTPSNAKYICAFVWLSSADTEITAQEMIDSVQIEVGETATAYAPYTGQTYPVVFPDTVFGGFVDLVTGEVWQTYYLASFKKSDFGDVAHGSAMDYRQSPYKSLPTSASGVDWNNARQEQKFNRGLIANPWGESAYGTNVGIVVEQGSSMGSYMRISESIYQAMSDDDYATISYKLATPVLLTTLTPQQITALIGNNTVWSDANGDCEVTFLKKG